MQASSRRVVQALPRLAPGQQVRNMSGHGSVEDNTKWMTFWMYSTFVALPLVTAFGYYTWCVSTRSVAGFINFLPDMTTCMLR